MTLREAVTDYLSRDGVAAGTISTERGCLAHWLAEDGDTQAGRLSEPRVIAYRKARLAAGIKAASVNCEVAALARVLKHAGIEPPVVKKLRSRSAPRRALTAEQKRALFRTAALKPGWSIAYDAAVLAACTTMRGAEIKALRVRDVDFIRGVLVVPKSKTDGGEGRVIPINGPAREVLQRRCGGMIGDAYVLHHGWPFRPVVSWRAAWELLVAAAGMPGLGFHALRHQAITELAEAGVPDATIKAIAGHVSQRMLEHYSHARVEAKRAGVEVLGV